MPIEIRELIIRTEVTIGGKNQGTHLREAELQHLKKQLLAACRKVIQENEKKKNYKR
ncbi:DUF5908 family protein [Ferruginibacter profundus]